MATKPIKDDNILGYLQKRSFDPKPKLARTLTTVNDEMIIDYARKSVAVTRMDGLFKPANDIEGMTAYEQQLTNAMAFVSGLLLANPDMNQSVTILDGTSWEDSVQSKDFELGIDFIVLIYKDGVYTAIVSLDMMKRMKKATHYFLRNQFFKRKLFLIDVDPKATAREILANIQYSIKITMSSGAPYLFYTNRLKRELTKIYKADNEYPVSAAFLMDDVIWSVPRPGRHHHILHSYEYHLFKESAVNKTLHQGFLTNHGNFISRKRAMFLAMRHHQIKGMGNFKMDYISLNETPHVEFEHRLGGLFNPTYDTSDHHYSICEVSLFSEDIW